MATAAATYTWAAKEDAIKAYLGLTGDDSEDTNLELWLENACAVCDGFVRWDWVDADGEAQAHGAGVWLGILEWVRVIRGHYRRGDVAGVTSRRTGALAESYGGGGMLDGYTMATAAARPHWHHDARTTWLQGEDG